MAYNFWSKPALYQTRANVCRRVVEEIQTPISKSQRVSLFLFSCFCSWLVLVRLFSSCTFLLRLNQGHTPLSALPSPSPSTTAAAAATTTPTTTTTSTYYYYYYDDYYYYYHYHSLSYSYSYAYSDAYSNSSTPLLLYTHLLLPPSFPKYYTGSAGS